MVDRSPLPRRRCTTTDIRYEDTMDSRPPLPRRRLQQEVGHQPPAVTKEKDQQLPSEQEDIRSVQILRTDGQEIRLVARGWKLESASSVKMMGASSKAASKKKSLDSVRPERCSKAASDKNQTQTAGSKATAMGSSSSKQPAMGSSSSKQPVVAAGSTGGKAAPRKTPTPRRSVVESMKRQLRRTQADSHANSGRALLEFCRQRSARSTALKTEASSAYEREGARHVQKKAKGVKQEEQEVDQAPKEEQESTQAMPSRAHMEVLSASVLHRGLRAQGVSSSYFHHP